MTMRRTVRSVTKRWLVVILPLAVFLAFGTDRVAPISANPGISAAIPGQTVLTATRNTNGTSTLHWRANAATSCWSDDFATHGATSGAVVVNPPTTTTYTVYCSGRLRPVPEGVFGKGNTTLTCIDFDGDGYGTGPGCLGPDADDGDPSVHSVADWKAKYGTLNAFLTHLGYSGMLRYWFISPTGNDSACAPGTSAEAILNPCATIFHIRKLLQPGDVVVFRGGTYTGDAGWTYLVKSGTVANPIMLIAYPGEKPILDHTGHDAFAATSISNMVVDGLTFTGENPNGAAFYGGANNSRPNSVGERNWIIRNVESGSGGDEIYEMENLHNWLIEHNILYHSLATENVYLGSRNLPNDHITFRDNIVFGVGGGEDYGWPALQHNGRVTNFDIEGNIFYGNGAASLSFVEGVSHSLVRNNLIFDNTREGLIIFESLNGDTPQGQPPCTNGICPYDQNYNTIENNTIVVGSYGGRNVDTSLAYAIGISNNSYHFVKDLGHQTFRNNVLVTDNGPPFWFLDDDVAAEFIRNNPTSAATSIFQNNLIYKTGKDPAMLKEGDTCALMAPEVEGQPPCTDNGKRPARNFDWSQLPSLTGTFTGNRNADPQFVRYHPANWQHPESQNFRLAPNSPGIRGGSPQTEATVDIQGMPQTSPPTIGAYASTQNASISFARATVVIDAPPLSLPR
jgi:hypothetical protein